MGKIESRLDEGYNATQIAEYLGREASCIQKEIKNFSIVKLSQKDCKNYENCNQKSYVNIVFQVINARVVETVK